MFSTGVPAACSRAIAATTRARDEPPAAAARPAASDSAARLPSSESQRVKPAASIVHSKIYREWRLTGTAFEFGDQVYDQPNRTLGSYAEGTLRKGKDHGIKKEIRGYYVDLVNGPFVPFGVDADRASSSYTEGLFDIQNKGTGTEQHRHHTVEVAMFNLLSYLWEIETGDPYAMKKVTSE